MSSTSVHDEWLSLIEISGPFLAIPVLKEVFPQGLEELDGWKRKRLRQAYEEWREALETDDPQFPELHAAWIDEVLSRGLELDEDRTGDVLKRGDRVPASLRVTSPEHGVTLAPDFAVVDSSHGDKPSMLIQTYEADVDLEATMKRDGWAASPAERMVQLSRLTGCRIGLVTNGERWMLVDAPVGAVTTFASWYARIWSQEPITLQAFEHLLGIRRFFFDESEQLPALFDRSLKHQDEVTEALGEQVRRAVEVLIQSLDKADLDRNRELLRDVAPAELYEAGLTVMMRLVFLLSAEERGLLLLGDERYEANYALSTLRMKLRTESEEILERRWDAWSRLLAVFRAVFDGVEHENLRLPALGGSLFDPDRFPFLEGRPKGSRWLFDAAKPLPIDNRTVLLLLEAIQQFQGRTLSYRALDVEQIGYVYEGLLERTVKRTDEVTLELDATKSAKTPWVKLVELESASLDGDDRLIELLLERLGSSTSRVRNDLAKPVEDALADRLLTACQGDLVLRDRIKPYAHLLRTDPWGYPLVYPKGAFIVTTGSDRRETGTHYTPKSLTEAIVTETLTPVAYVGPAEGKPREEWRLKSPTELLDLKICDPAMGSGAFLVQVCRWLSERLVEAWEYTEKQGKVITSEGEIVDELGSREPLRSDAEERLLTAHRLIAERCLYGVDVNPLAVELAKLSIWLVTLAKGRPFGFLDHNLRSGDTLLGTSDIRQLYYLDFDFGPGSSKKLFASHIDKAVEGAIKLRTELRSRSIRDIRDVEFMSEIDEQARQKLSLPIIVADALIGKCLAAGNGEVNAEALGIDVGEAIGGNEAGIAKLKAEASADLKIDLQSGKAPRKPFHWPLEFPEVFGRENGGFDALIGNPPYLGGTRITGRLGTAYRNYLIRWVAKGIKGSADLVAYFFLRVFDILRHNGSMGLLAVNTIAEGDTRQVGLERMIKELGTTIIVAYPNEPWPGKAAVATSRIHIWRGEWQGKRFLNGSEVSIISAYLSAQDEWSPKQLKTNSGLALQGAIVLGMGFVLTLEQAQEMINDDPRNSEVIFPYLNGDDLNGRPNQSANRWVINFWDWPEERARQYARPYQLILEKVKPERQRTDENGDYIIRSARAENWWQHAEKCIGLYHLIGRGHYFEKHPKNSCANQQPMPNVIVQAKIGKYFNPSIIANDIIFDQEVIVITKGAPGALAFFNSSIVQHWAWKNSSIRPSGSLAFSPADSLGTLPLPSDLERSELLHDLGARLNHLRKQVMLERSIGHTDLYNRFHSPKENNAKILELRRLHEDIDHAVGQSYGWHDLDLRFDFHEIEYLMERDRVRCTYSKTTRVEILKRLALLNRQSYQGEQQDQQTIGRKSDGKKKQLNTDTKDLFQPLDK